MRPVRRLTFAASVALLASPLALPAQGNTSVHPTPPPVADAVRREGIVTIDGKLDDAAWSRATPITDFRQSQPNDGAKPSLRTEVRILFDDEALYIGARMVDPQGAAAVRAPLARRDQLLDANGNNGSFNSLTTDKLIVELDPYHNHIDDVWFEVNPAGVRGDQFNGDPAWDPIWEAASQIDAQGWTAEMRIPYSQLRFSRDTAQTWGMQIWRYADRINEQDMWSYRARNESGGPAFWGHLQGITIANRPRQLEVLPYVVSRGQFRYAAPSDPYHTKSDMGLNAGADIKYLLTSNLTLDATINPDFGQVEVDPASLNLSAFETYYDEKRPFFVAGQNAFSFGGMSCFFCDNVSGLGVFYTRRIGRPPQLNDYVRGQAGNDGFADTPDNATILGAAKITGRTNSGFTVGLLDAVTNRETAHYVTTAGGPELSQQVEPLTNYFVGRVKKEFRQGATTVGTIVTSTTRSLDDSVSTNLLRRQATAVGLDWSHAWNHRTYRWRGNAVVSDVRGSTESIDLTQRSSAHYFQRPDRRVTSDGLFDVAYDPNATSLQGYGFYTRLAKENGDWLWETAQNWRSPGFETNDLSFLDRADYKWMNANVGRQWVKPRRWYRNIFTTVGFQQEFNYDGLRSNEDAHAYYGMEFPNYWNLRTFYIRYFANDDASLTRGGPAVKRTGYDFGHFQVSTDARRRAVFDVTLQGTRGIDAPTRSFTFSPGMALKPAANIFVELSPAYDDSESDAQYVTTAADPSATLFNGNRYVFGFIRTKTVVLETRVNWTFRPDITLQLYAQPFVATGDYSSFREFAAPRTARKLVYGQDIGTICEKRDATGAVTGYGVNPGLAGIDCSKWDPSRAGAFPIQFDNPDFTYRSLRGTAVLRWEYRPGSTMFFVWTQQRSGVDPFGDFQFHRDYSGLFHDRPDNVFLVKATYWIGR
ncbi:MAG: carbohydrate binding family 9 domain-containing protein [Gemmatimonadaceae bacterium]|nr:carbohydrate binding family 9 domain-containing protein [Gemmatimonadaceae bacterium]NUQ92404.1 carbohydrate binding family 9 domain-containing protein [Gemmatimonadaceae bacterium]NUR18288.1 carbohydrate binding family 9 domain-containing protein [Gemmatimonadaceae bacterium]